ERLDLITEVTAIQPKRSELTASPDIDLVGRGDAQSPSVGESDTEDRSARIDLYTLHRTRSLHGEDHVTRPDGIRAPTTARRGHERVARHARVCRLDDTDLRRRVRGARVDPVDEDHSRVAGAPGGAHDALEHLFRREPPRHRAGV